MTKKEVPVWFCCYKCDFKKLVYFEVDENGAPIFTDYSVSAFHSVKIHLGKMHKKEKGYFGANPEARLASVKEK